MYRERMPGRSENAPLRVLHIFRTWGMGGAQTIALSLFRHLGRFNIDQTFLAYQSHQGADEEFLDAAKAIGIPLAKERLDWRGFRDWRRCVAGIRRVAAGFDLIHTHDNQSTTLVGLSRQPCARIATAYGWWDLNLKVKAYYAIERRLALPRFDRVTTVSENMRAKAIKGGVRPDKIDVIHTGLEPAAFARHDRAAARAAFGIPTSAIVFGNVSRLSPEKGQAIMLRAAAPILAARPEMRLMLVGKGPERASLEAEAASLGLAGRVHFAGYVEDVAIALAAMDSFILPSTLDEGFPTCLLEAQAAGLPVIATDVGGTSETFLPGMTGLLVRPGDEGDLSRAISALADAAESRRAMGEAGRKRALKEFTVEAMVGRMAGSYAKAAGAFHPLPLAGEIARKAEKESSDADADLSRAPRHPKLVTRS
jgi:glycosyltransferase involved in cell wall biosynthesis